MTIFLLMTFVRVPSYVGHGLVTGPRLWSTLVVMPAVLLGAWLGHRLHLQISERPSGGWSACCWRCWA